MAHRLYFGAGYYHVDEKPTWTAGGVPTTPHAKNAVATSLSEDHEGHPTTFFNGDYIKKSFAAECFQY